MNSIGANDDILRCSIYFPENDLATCFFEPFFKNTLMNQLAANRWPDRITPADYSRDYMEYNDTDISHRWRSFKVLLLIWQPMTI